MANPLTGRNDNPQSAHTVDLLAWCDEQNRKPLMERMERWYYVAKDDSGIDRIDCLHGCDATNVRKLFTGKLETFAGWPDKRLGGYRRWLRACLVAGMFEPAAAA